MSLTLKRLNEVMRDSKTYSQTKALYSYLWIRADRESGLSYPPKKQILSEINLTEDMYKQCLGVLIKKQYIKETTKDNIDKEGRKYTINCYDLNDYSKSDAKEIKLF
jgi:hypothetical protein